MGMKDWDLLTLKQIINNIDRLTGHRNRISYIGGSGFISTSGTPIQAYGIW
jgi:hypothetical protein